MSDLRDLMARAVGFDGEPPDALERIRERVRRRARIRTASAIALALAASASAVLFLRLSFGPVLRQGGEVTAGTRPVLTPHVAATIPVGDPGEVDSVVFGFGSVWVSGGAPQGYVLKVDPRSGEVLAEIPADRIGWEDGGGSLAVGQGSVWAVGAGIWRIDPSTGVASPLDGVDLAPPSAQDAFVGAIAVAEQHVWVAPLTYPYPVAGEVIRLDPVTGEVVARVLLPEGFGYARRILPTPSTLWVLAARTDEDTVGGMSLIAVDPGSNEVTGIVDPAPFPVVTDGESLWGSQYLQGEGSWALARIDGATGEIVESIPIGAERIEHVATGDGVWFLSEGNVIRDGNVVNVTGGRYRLSHLDPTTGGVEIVAEGTSGGGVIDMAVSPGSVWLLHRDGTLTRVDVP